MAFFAHLNSKVMELQRQLAQDHGQFAKLNLEVDRTLDKLKLFENKVNGETIDKLKLFENPDAPCRHQRGTRKATFLATEMRAYRVLNAQVFPAWKSAFLVVVLADIQGCLSCG